MRQSENLTAFYRAYLAWAENGAPPCVPFHAHYGLCWSIDHMPGVRDTARLAMKKEMQAQFKAHGLCKMYPFGEEEYDFTYSQNLHEQPERIQWVRDRIAEAEQS